MKKIIASELDNKQMLIDSFLVIGESYENLREFDKALDWYTRSWKEYQFIGDFEVSYIFLRIIQRSWCFVVLTKN